MSARDKKIIIVLVGAVLLALSYFLVFQQAQEKKAQLESENMILKQKYDELSILATKVEDYKKEMVVMSEEKEKILAHYPSYLQIEDTIMDVVSLEEDTKSRVSNLSVATPVAIDVVSTDENNATMTDGTAPADGTAQADGTKQADGTTPADSTSTDGTNSEQTANGAANDGTQQNAASQNNMQPNYQLYQVESTINFEANNKGLKKLIELLAGATNRQRIASLTVAFNEGKGKLDGTLIYDAYFLYGIDKAYEAPYIPSMPHGTENIFGTVSE